VPPLQGGRFRDDFIMGNEMGKHVPGRCPGLSHRRAVGT